jgi:hypothetical protein
MKKHSVGLLELEMGVLECFLEKTPLSPLGVNQQPTFYLPTLYHGMNKAVIMESIIHIISLSIFIEFANVQVYAQV